MNKQALFLGLFFTVLSLFAQKKKDVLLTVGDTPVLASEFKRVYEKNLDLVQDESQKSVDGYLQLFIDYKLKVAEAYDQKLHEDPTYVKEFAQYQDQLARTYIYEDKVTEELAREVFKRGLEEVNVDHILVRSSFNDNAQDTLKAYQKITDIRKKALAGEDFTTLAKTYSEEPGAKERAGKLGWFSAFAMVHPFEDMAYKTGVGEISEIVRTSFGYHVLKVIDRRKREPEITVSHIMVSDNDSKRTFDPKERINELYNLLQQGESFESVAKQYSDDKNSAKNGGKLRRFGKGDLRSVKFAEAAYGLKNIGDITQPLKSEFGWHIIRLEEKHSAPTFEDKKDELEKKVQQGTRAKLVTAAINNQIKDKYGFKKGVTYNEYFQILVTDSVVKRNWIYDTPIPKQENKTMFTIGDKDYTYHDFASFIEVRQKKGKMANNKAEVLRIFNEEFETKSLKDYFKNKLEEENDEYAGVISEYRDGLLIFEVMAQNVWNKAKNDSVGLDAYFKKNQNAYRWKQRVEAVVVSSTSKDIAIEAAQLLQADTSSEELKEKLNTAEKTNVIVSKGKYEIGDDALPDNFKTKKGVSEVYQQNDTFIVVKVLSLIPAGVKSLPDVRGKVLSAYQEQIETNWLQSLRKKYDVKVNKKTLKKIKKSFKN